MKSKLFVLLMAAALLWGLGVSASWAELADTKAPAKVEHPEVDETIACADCHADIHPEVVQAWYAGPHGMNNVLCFVCHGSTGEDFTIEPTPERCLGCHPQQVATMEHPKMKEKSCFSCHSAHALNPHWTPAGGDQ
ncbi:MAG: multiheme c-type cytochrome [Thermoanaerobaculia bacterium]